MKTTLIYAFRITGWRPAVLLGPFSRGCAQARVLARSGEAWDEPTRIREDDTLPFDVRLQSDRLVMAELPQVPGVAA